MSDSRTAFKMLDEAALSASQALNNISKYVNLFFRNSALPDTMRDYYLHIATPKELVERIINEPNHTWNGVTIYPDEAWRYENTSDWIWWRRGK